MPEYQLYCFAQSGNAYRAALMLNLIDAVGLSWLLSCLPWGFETDLECRAQCGGATDSPPSSKALASIRSDAPKPSVNQW